MNWASHVGNDRVSGDVSYDEEVIEEDPVVDQDEQQQEEDVPSTVEAIEEDKEVEGSVE